MCPKYRACAQKMASRNSSPDSGDSGDSPDFPEMVHTRPVLRVGSLANGPRGEGATGEGLSASWMWASHNLPSLTAALSLRLRWVEKKNKYANIW